MKAMATRGSERFLRDAISRELASTDCLIDSREILQNNATRRESEMADFGLPHWASGQPHIRATSAEFAARIIAIELVVKGSAGKKSGVAVLVTRFLAAWIDAPAITNDEHHRAGHMRALCR